MSCLCEQIHLTRFGLSGNFEALRIFELDHTFSKPTEMVSLLSNSLQARVQAFPHPSPLIGVLLLFVFSCPSVFAQPDAVASSTSLSELLEHAETEPWEVVREKEGVVLKYRDITFEDGSSTRQVLAEFELSAPLDTILHYLKDPGLVAQWNDGFDSCKIVDDYGNRWVSYCIYDIPFPLSQQDVFSDYRIERSQHQTVLKSYARPDYQPEVDGYEREQCNFGEWTLKQSGHNRFKVSFGVITLSSSNVPDFIKDPIIQRTLLKSFISLRESVAQ